MTNLVTAPEVHKKIMGMQIMIEGLALGIFANFMQPVTGDPVLARLLRGLLITDEAYHHRFGQIWGLAPPQLNEEQHQQVENWAAACFLTISRNVVGVEAKAEIYSRFGLDTRWVQGAMAEAFATSRARRNLAAANSYFRILVKTLAQIGLITSRTKPLFNIWFDVEELSAEALTRALPTVWRPRRQPNFANLTKVLCG